MPLPERVTQLLTAYIDGELSSRQRRAIGRLLRKSPEARKLLDKMQQDSMILRHLPRKKVRPDLSKTVMTTLDLRGIKLPPAPPLSAMPGMAANRARKRAKLFKVVAAALLLAAIGVGSYFAFSLTAPAPTPPRSTSADTAPAK